MKRYYLSPIIGDGTRENPFRAKLRDLAVNHVAVIPTGVDGRPLFAWCLTLAAATDHAPVLADPTIDTLPDLSLDARLNTLTLVERQALWIKLDSRTIDRSDLGTNSTYRDIIRRIGRHLDIGFIETSFDVSE